MNVMGIDPGKQGAFVVLGETILGPDHFFFEMPIDHIGEVDFDAVTDFLSPFHKDNIHVYLERAKPMAMGSKHAFNYGRDFAKIEMALHISRIPTIYVEPTTWMKTMHEGISKDLNPKVRSRIAAERLFPFQAKMIKKNKNDKLHEGIVEALLIAGFGQRQLNTRVRPDDLRITTGTLA